MPESVRSISPWCPAFARGRVAGRVALTTQGLRMAGRGYRCRVPRLRRHLALVALARAFKPGSPGMGRRLAALPRLIRASIRGEYDAGTRLLLMAAASLYILSPLDAIPELFTAFIGLVDD